MFFGIRPNTWLQRRQVVPQTALLLSLIVVAGIALSSSSGKADDSLQPAQATIPTRSDRTSADADARSSRAVSGSSAPTTFKTGVDARPASHSRDSAEADRQRHILQILILRDVIGQLRPFLK